MQQYIFKFIVVCVIPTRVIASHLLFPQISVSNREGTMYRQLISSEFDDFKIDPPNGLKHKCIKLCNLNLLSE